jgi:hypothetical protein
MYLKFLLLVSSKEILTIVIVQYVSSNSASEIAQRVFLQKVPKYPASLTQSHIPGESMERRLNTA